MWVLIGFLGMVVLGVPVGFCMVLAGFFYVLITQSVSLTFVPQAMVSGVSSYTMLAIPFFMIVGELMNSSGITKRIVTIQPLREMNLGSSQARQNRGISP